MLRSRSGREPTSRRRRGQMVAGGQREARSHRSSVSRILRPERAPERRPAPLPRLRRGIVVHAANSLHPSSFLLHTSKMSIAITRGIRVEVESFYVPERSEPGERYFFFAYRVRIANKGQETARLLSREWIITDGDGNEETVRGDGVVGEQPLLRPG